MLRKKRHCAPRAVVRRKPVVAKVNGEWPARRIRPGSSTEEQLVEKYIPLVRTVVGRLAMTLPPHVDGEDLYSAGLGGLLSAVRQYNPRAGTAFETYARLRIRGAVFDELRRMDWVPRSVHTKARKVQAVMQQIEQSKGRLATEEEMARALKITVDEYSHWLDEIRPATFVCLDAAFQNEYDDGVSQYESLPDNRQENPMDGTFRREISRMIGDRINQLPEMQRKVLALYYFEDMRLREIADVFGLTESRICQIHAQAVLAIKSHLQKYDPYFVYPGRRRGRPQSRNVLPSRPLESSELHVFSGVFHWHTHCLEGIGIERQAVTLIADRNRRPGQGRDDRGSLPIV
jgi:RNA polymerase sigma factor for flagellar operon FliA